MKEIFVITNHKQAAKTSLVKDWTTGEIRERVDANSTFCIEATNKYEAVKAVDEILGHENYSITKFEEQ